MSSKSSPTFRIFAASRMESVLLYLASGNYKPVYEELNFSRIFLVDNHIRHNFSSNKVVPLHMDAVKAIELLKGDGVKVDCLVCLCESQGEGGQTYDMCSDIIMGYLMPILSENFIWICNDPLYYLPRPYRRSLSSIPNSNIKLHNFSGQNLLTFNLPYRMTELVSGDAGYISPNVFSDSLDECNRGHVFRMTFNPLIEDYSISNKITIRLIQDSIWNHYEELDQLYISFQLACWSMEDYFNTIDKVEYYRQMEFYDKLIESQDNGYSHIGFTPHYWQQYDKNYQKQLERFLRQVTHPIVIDFYYLNSWVKTKHIKKAIKTELRSAK